MKKYFCALLIVAAFSCKKEGSGNGSGKLLLSKIYMNDLLQEDYTYSTEGKLIRVNYYLSGGGVSTLSTYRIYDYNSDGTVKELLHYSKDHYAVTRRVFTYNADKKVSRIDEASIFTGTDDLDDFDYVEVYYYDTKGQLEQMAKRLPNFTQHSRYDYEYDDKGKLVYYEYHLMDDGAMVMKQKGQVEAGNKQLPQHWKDLLVLPIDYSWYQLYSNKFTYTSYYSGPAGNSSVWTYLNRQYNGQGYLISEESQLESYGAVNLNEFRYEYVHQ